MPSRRRVKTVTRAYLARLLARVRHSTFLGFTALTRVKTTTVDAPPIWKLNRVSLCCGSYENAVNRRRETEGHGVPPTFTAAPRKWGKYVGRSLALVAHTPKGADAVRHYVAGQVLRAKEPLYLIERPPFRPHSRPRFKAVPKEAIAQWLPEHRSQAAAQGVTQEVVHRDYALDSLSTVALLGRVYRLKD